MGNSDLEARIAELDSKDAANLARDLVQEVFAAMEEVPPIEEIGGTVGSAFAAAGEPLDLLAKDNWHDLNLQPAQAGSLARALLVSMARDSDRAPLVRTGLERPRHETLDLGVMPITVAIALVYLTVVTEIRIEKGSLRVWKPPMTPDHMVALVKALPKSVVDLLTKIFA